MTVSNTAPAGSFTEGLNANFGANAGDAPNNAGGISLLAGGASNNGNMTVGLDTSTAGAKSGSVDVNYQSEGTGTSGLAASAAGSQTVNLTGTVVDQAVSVINTAQPIVLGNVREGAISPTASVSVTNQATGNLQAALNAEITGNAPITASGSFNLLDPGGTAPAACRSA